MSSRQLQRARLRKVPVGDMRTPVIIHQAQILAPIAGVDLGRKITAVVEPWFCKVTTPTGVYAFDSSNIEQIITHDFQGRFVDSVDRDMVIEWNSEYYRIISVEDFEERHEFLRLRCTVRGAIASETKTKKRKQQCRPKQNQSGTSERNVRNRLELRGKKKGNTRLYIQKQRLTNT